MGPWRRGYKGCRRTQSDPRFRVPAGRHCLRPQGVKVGVWTLPYAEDECDIATTRSIETMLREREGAWLQMWPRGFVIQEGLLELYNIIEKKGWRSHSLLKLN